MYNESEALTVYQHLLDQTPTGPRIIEMGATCKCYVLPRNSIADMVKEYKELRQHCIYILLGKDTEGRPMAYIGESKDFSDREKDHEIKKKFWDKAMVFVSRADNIYQSEIDYLEHLAQKAAFGAGSYILDNSRIEPEPGIQPTKKQEMNRFFKDIVFLAQIYGCKLFDNIDDNATSNDEESDKLIPCFLTRNSNAQGLFNPETTEVTVLKGSKINPKHLPNLKDTALETRKNQMAEYVKKKGGEMIVQKDAVFSTPSGAAKFCIGGAADGWESWVDNDGKPIKVYRKK